jgi:tRNA-specific 2-thiouridylase
MICATNGTEAIITAASGIASSQGNASTGQGLTAVAMSGGVDSSVAAAILHERGESIVGLTMQLWNQRRLPELQSKSGGGHRCCSLDDVYDARRVAQHLGFPYYVVNYQSEFENTVVRPFVADYLAGRTPIPCSLCNNHVKFDRLAVTMREIGAERLVTGHYARIHHNSTTGRYELLRAVDTAKDQTYFLFGLTQEQLAISEFPLGAMTKDQVRAIARRTGLPVAEKLESQEICFVPGGKGDYVRFIQAYQAEQGIEAADAAGEIVTTKGDVVGRHNGLHGFTVGQRKGLGLAVGRPLYVVELQPETNRVVVGEDDELLCSGCIVDGINWISIAPPHEPLEAAVQIRNRHVAALAEIAAHTDGSATVHFSAPQRAITPGQAAVFYMGDLVLGGGWIRCALDSTECALQKAE